MVERKSEKVNKLGNHNLGMEKQPNPANIKFILEQGNHDYAHLKQSEENIKKK